MQGKGARRSGRLEERSNSGVVKSRSRQALAALALCVLTSLVYSNSFQAGFALDNRRLLLQDPRIREASVQNLQLIFKHTYWWPDGESGLYRPITTASYLFNYAILGNGGRPAGYHWINLILHLGNVLLVNAVALLLIRQFWPPVFIAALWALHPVSTESVTNIIGRSDLLAAMSVLSGFLFYLKSSGTERVWRRLGWLAGLAAVTSLGVFSKESAVTVLGVIALYELTFWRDRKRGRALFLGCLAVLPPLLAMWRMRAAVLAGSGPVELPFVDNPLTGADFWTARLTAIRVMARYLWLAVWPLKLSCDYSYSQIPLARGSLEDWIAWMVMAAIMAALAILFLQNRVAFFLASFAFVTFLPTSNLLFPIGTIMAERFLYLPSAGLIACIVLVLYKARRWARLPSLAPVVLCVIAAAFSIRTWARNLDWRDDLTMASAAVRTSPNSFKTHFLLARALYESDPSHSNLDRVIGEAEKSLAILNPLADAHNNAAAYRWAGECYLLKGDLLRRSDPGGNTVTIPEGVKAYQRSTQILLRCLSILKASHSEAGDAGLYRVLSIAYLRLADTDKAFDAAANAIKLEPLNSESYRQIAEVLLAAGRSDDAAAKLLEGVILTADVGLWEELLSLYRSGLDPEGCATISGPRGPSLNPACEIVRKHFCAAAPDTIRIRIQTLRRDLAREMKDTALQKFRCPPGPLNQILPDGPGK